MKQFIFTPLAFSFNRRLIPISFATRAIDLQMDQLNIYELTLATADPNTTPGRSLLRKTAGCSYAPEHMIIAFAETSLQPFGPSKITELSS